MSKPIHDVTYWHDRLLDVRRKGKPLHHAIYVCSTAEWERIAAKHAEILKRHILLADTVLDCGCGWGRLLGLLPDFWAGDYHGVDLSPDFVEMAQREHPDHSFQVGDLRHLTEGDEAPSWKFDWAVLISIRPMIKREMGEEEWKRVEREIRKVAKRLLYLEYDENDEGSVE